jgi:hypothetical protein
MHAVSTSQIEARFYNGPPLEPTQSTSAVVANRQTLETTEREGVYPIPRAEREKTVLHRAAVAAGGRLSIQSP